MKNRDYKMRIRFEQKEYYPDKYGETRVDKVRKKKIKKCKSKSDLFKISEV